MRILSTCILIFFYFISDMCETAPCHSLLLATLSDACSQDTLKLHSAACQLEQWETSPGFYSALLHVALNYNVALRRDGTSAATNLRWLAVVYFKNGVERYWRPSAPHAINETEKTEIRARLQAEALEEPVPQIALQFAVLIAKMARNDMSRAWPDLLPWLSAEVQQKDQPTRQYNALQVLHHVVKMLSSKRLPSDRHLFEQLTEELLPYMADSLTVSLSEVETGLFVSDMDATRLNVVLNHSLICVKVLLNLLQFGVHHIEPNSPAVVVVRTCLLKLPFFLKCGTFLHGFHTALLFLPLCEKLCYLLTKLINNFQNMHHIAFVPFIGDALNMAVFSTLGDNENVSATNTETTRAALPEKVVVNLLNLVRQIMLCDDYQPLTLVRSRNLTQGSQCL